MYIIEQEAFSQTKQQKLKVAATRFADNEVANSPLAQVAQFIQAVIALQQKQPLPPVPSRYEEKILSLQKELG